MIVVEQVEQGPIHGVTEAVKGYARRVLSFGAAATALDTIHRALPEPQQPIALTVFYETAARQSLDLPVTGDLTSEQQQAVAATAVEIKSTLDKISARRAALGFISANVYPQLQQP